MSSSHGGTDRRAARVLDALHRIALAQCDATNPPELARLVARHARDLLQADDVVVYIFEADAAVLRLAYGENTGHHLLETMAVGQGAIGRAFE